MKRDRSGPRCLMRLKALCRLLLEHSWSFHRQYNQMPHIVSYTHVIFIVYLPLHIIKFQFPMVIFGVINISDNVIEETIDMNDFAAAYDDTSFVL